MGDNNRGVFERVVQETEEGLNSSILVVYLVKLHSYREMHFIPFSYNK